MFASAGYLLQRRAGEVCLGTGQNLGVGDTELVAKSAGFRIDVRVCAHATPCSARICLRISAVLICPAAQRALIASASGEDCRPSARKDATAFADAVVRAAISSS